LKGLNYKIDERGMHMNAVKRTIALILFLVLIIGNIAFADDLVIIKERTPATDFEGHWARATIEKWLAAGRISGYPDGSFKPDNKVTRAEFVKMVNGIIDYNKPSDIAFKDVPAGSWFYDYIRVAQAIGYISGYSANEFGPNDPITREQAAAILARIQYLRGNAAGVNRFTDKGSLAGWAVEAAGAASEAGFISGYVDGSFKPQNNLTRAEAITMLDNVLENAKNVVVYNDGTELKDMVIEGDLIIAKTVGEGSVYLTNLEIKGEIQVYGGGMNSIYFKNVKVAKIEVVKDKVRLVFEDGSVIENIDVGEETVIVNEDGEIQMITVTDTEGVVLTGNFGEVTVSGVEKITLKDAEITKLIVEEKVTILGTGKITSLEANADGILYEKDVKIDKVEVGEGVKDEPEVIKEEPVGGGGGGGGFIPTPAKVTLRIEVKSPDADYPQVFNTEKFNVDNKISDAVLDILGDGSYTSKFNEFIDKFILRIDEIEVDDLTDVEEIWNKFEAYLPNEIDLDSLKSAVLAKNVEVTDIIAAFNEFKGATDTEINQIIANINGDSDFDNMAFKFNDKELTYTLTSTKGTMPTTNKQIAEFIITQLLKANKTLGKFADDYGSVTLEAALTGTGKTAFIKISVIK
jgi:hypothetical protein